MLYVALTHVIYDMQYIRHHKERGISGMSENENQVEKIQPDPADIEDTLQVNVMEIVKEYIDKLENPEEIYNNNGLFVDMLKYIYMHYLGDVIGNKHSSYNFKYDYELLNKIFYIYTHLVYTYKQNKRPSILEFSLFVQMDRTSIYNTANGYNKTLTPDVVNMVKKWYTECENQLTNGGSVFEIFLLKSQYRYNDNLAPIPIENQGATLAVNELPDLGIQKIAKTDNQGKKSENGKS